MKKKLMAVTAITAVMLMGTGNIHAADSQDTTVTYNNGAEIGDDPSYAVTVPAAITIDDTNTNTSFTVEAVSKNGDDISTVLAGKSLNIAVTSLNSYKLTMSGDRDPVEYTLSKKQFTLTGAAPSDTSTVTLGGTATMNGDHSDILTFTLTVN